MVALMPSKLKGPPFPEIKKFNGAGRELDEIQRAVDLGTRDARKNPENAGRRIDGIRIPASTDTPNTVTINHRLGRKPQGLRAVRATGAPANFFEVSSDSKRIVIQGAGTTASTADFWVH
jgi:hypothetical protein